MAQDAHTDGVEGRHPHTLGHGADQPAHALFHFRGGLISKGNGEDLPRIYPAMAHEIGNAAGKHGSLARTSAGHDEQRAARVGNGLKLLWVEALGQGIGRIRLRARCARCAEAAKGAWCGCAAGGRGRAKRRVFVHSAFQPTSPTGHAPYPPCKLLFPFARAGGTIWSYDRRR